MSSQKDRERKRGLLYLGHGPSGTQKFTSRPSQSIFCPLCKEEISLTNKNNIVALYFVHGETEKAHVYKEGRICPHCGIVTTESGRVRYKRKNPEQNES